MNKCKLDFQDGGYLAFPIRTIFLPFFIYNLSQYFLPSFQSIAFSVQKKCKIDFQDGRHGDNLGLLIRKILAFFYLRCPILPTKFRVNWRFGSEDGQNRFSRWPSWQPSWVATLDFCSERLSHFLSTNYPDTSYQVLNQLALRFRRRCARYIFRMGAILDFRSK